MKTVRTAVRLLRQFSIEEPEMGVSDLARRLDLDKATVHRLLRSLAEEKLVEQDPESRRYRLGLGTLDLAGVRLAQFGYVDLAVERLEKLRAETGETVALIARDGAEVMCLQVLEAPHPIRVSYYVGERLPLHCTAAGLLFLAALPEGEARTLLGSRLARFTPRTVTDPKAILRRLGEVRERGVAMTDETYFPGIRTIAAPVRDRGGRTIAAIAVAAPSTRMPDRAYAAAAEATKAAAADISRALGARAVAPAPVVRIGLTPPR